MDILKGENHRGQACPQVTEAGGQQSRAGRGDHRLPAARHSDGRDEEALPGEAGAGSGHGWLCLSPSRGPAHDPRSEGTGLEAPGPVPGGSVAPTERGGASPEAQNFSGCSRDQPTTTRGGGCWRLCSAAPAPRMGRRGSERHPNCGLTTGRGVQGHGERGRWKAMDPAWPAWASRCVVGPGAQPGREGREVAGKERTV